MHRGEHLYVLVESQCTYRCVVLPDKILANGNAGKFVSQCTYRCVVLPDGGLRSRRQEGAEGLNAPTGAWCSLTCS